MLKIEEAGLNDLVNKFIREKVQKDEGRQFSKEELHVSDEDEAQNKNSPDLLFNKDEMQERAIVRSLLEFGLKEWEKNITVADYILKEFDNDLENMIENSSLVSVINIYRKLYQEGNEPSAKDFLYHSDKELSLLVIDIMDSQSEISPNWANRYEGKIYTREDLFKEEVISTLSYFKLRKIKRMIDENHREMEKAGTDEEQFLYLKTHLALKKEEQAITEQTGTVIFK